MSGGSLRGQRVTILGLGKSGLAAAKLAAREGARVTGTDARPESELTADAALLRSLGVALELGGHRLESFTGADLVVKSPGVKPSVPPIAAALGAGVPVIGEVELCAPFLGTPIVGITGTNGKSTTTALCGHLLQASGLRVFVGGNLGTPVADHVLEGGAVDATVLELSSYQVDDLATFRCDAATVLNLTPDHLERYGTMERYAASKERLFSLVRPGGTKVVNAHDSWTIAMGERATGRIVTFGRGAVQAGHARADGPSFVASNGHRYTVAAPTLRGAHNVENAMAAVELALAVGADPSRLQAGLDSYPGLAHRLEIVRRIGGVEWVNDSKATNVDSVEKSLGALPGPLHLILGGLGKGTPYAPLRPLFPGRVARTYLVGQDAERIRAELGDLAPFELVGDVATAVARAHAHAKSGDTVLLSPACASWDQFRSFEHRGEVFRALVNALEGA